MKKQFVHNCDLLLPLKRLGQRALLYQLLVGVVEAHVSE